MTGRRFPAGLRSRDGWARWLEAQRSPFPHIHQIEPTNHCPYHCVMCPRSGRMTRPQGFMNPNLFTRLVDEIATYTPEVRDKEIELFHFGESLLHPEIARLTALASERGLKAVLSVNPPHLKPRLIEPLLRAHPHRIILSMDGWDTESYSAIRGSAANFDTAVAAVEALHEVHARLSSTTDIVLRMIVMAGNRPHVEEVCEFWRSRGVMVELRDFFPWTEPAMVPLGSFQRNPPFMPCPFPWRYLVVQWDGTVVACCRDYDAVNVLGNARTQSLVEIWNGPAAAAFRDRHRCGAVGDNPLCAPCDKIYYCEE